MPRTLIALFWISLVGLCLTAAGPPLPELSSAQLRVGGSAFLALLLAVTCYALHTRDQLGRKIDELVQDARLADTERRVEVLDERLDGVEQVLGDLKSSDPRTAADALLPFALPLSDPYRGTFHLHPGHQGYSSIGMPGPTGVTGAQGHQGAQGSPGPCGSVNCPTCLAPKQCPTHAYPGAQEQQIRTVESTAKLDQAIGTADAVLKTEVHPSHELCSQPPVFCVKCEAYPSQALALHRPCPDTNRDKTEYCCDCSNTYPRADLMRGYIYCPTCRFRHAAQAAATAAKRDDPAPDASHLTSEQLLMIAIAGG